VDQYFEELFQLLFLSSAMPSIKKDRYVVHRPQKQMPSMKQHKNKETGV